MNGAEMNGAAESVPVVGEDVEDGAAAVEGVGVIETAEESVTDVGDAVADISGAGIAEEGAESVPAGDVAGEDMA